MISMIPISYFPLGLNCNLTNTQCDLIQPCQNNATCTNTNSTPSGYICTCLDGFDGLKCQNNHRICQKDTCWNNGICNETSNTTFFCSRPFGWQGIYCQTMVNYCQNITCLNHAVCRSHFLNFTCECLNEDYSGRYCEIISTKTVTRKILSKSFTFVAILAVTIVASYFIFMDILKYVFGIDLVQKELLRIRRTQRIGKRKKRKKVKPRIIIRVTYVNRPNPGWPDLA